jgi:RNA polymerase sigma-70 factor (ECF subfamily)
VPPNPEAWLLTTAKNRAIDRLRHERLPVEPLTLEQKPDTDDRLAMIFLCCHPSLSEEMQVALTLQVVCGLNAREIARGLMLSESAVAQRLVRAKRQLREAGARFQSDGRLETVLSVLYLLFNEGYAATDQGPAWFRPDLCEEAIYLARLLTATREPAVHALLALFLLQASRLPARIDAASGEAVPLPDQDRARWDRRLMGEGFVHLEASASGEIVTAYHLEAEIAAKHAAATSFAVTDWDGIADLYSQLPDSPAVRLNRAIAVGYRDGARAGLAALAPLDSTSHLHAAARAEFHSQAGDIETAAFLFGLAAGRARTEPERLYLSRRRDMLDKK